jgi:hypothetical protein
MPFTLMRYKDGKETPIKVSILDAFRSTPPRRPKAAKPIQTEEKKVKVRFLFPQSIAAPVRIKPQREVFSRRGEGPKPCCYYIQLQT